MIDCVKCLLLCVIYIHLYHCSSNTQGGANSQLPFALVLYPLYLFLLLHHKPSYHLLTFYSCDDCFPQSLLHQFTFILLLSCTPNTHFFYHKPPLFLLSCIFSLSSSSPSLFFSTSFLPLLHPLPVTTLFLPPSHCPSICRVRLPRQLVCQLANICPHH